MKGKRNNKLETNIFKQSKLQENNSYRHLVVAMKLKEILEASVNTSLHLEGNLKSNR